MTSKRSDVSDAPCDVRLGILVTELLSHLSPFYAGPGVYEKELASNRFSVDHPSFYGAVFEVRGRLDADRRLATFLKQTGIFMDSDARAKFFRGVLVAKRRSQN